MGMDERQPAEDIAAMGAPASPDALKEIVARHHRRRTRTLGVLLAVALIAGPIAGWAVGQGGGGGGQQIATGSNGGTPTAANAPAGPVGGSAAGSAIAEPAGSPPKATHLFTRTTSDGITIRAYRMDPPAPPTPPPSTPSTTTGKAQTICPKPMPVEPPGPATGSGGAGVSSGGAETKPAPPSPAVNGGPPPCAPGAPPMCKAGPSVLAEVSNDAAVGQGFDPIDEKQPADALSHLEVPAFGVAEGSPAIFAIVQTGPGVANVRLRLPSGATDEMAPSGGIAVLAHGTAVPAPDGTVVEALDANGNVLQSLPVTQPGPKMGFACGVMVGPAGQPAVRALQAPPATPPTTR